MGLRYDELELADSGYRYGYDDLDARLKMIRKPRKASAADLRYIEDMKRTSAFEKLDRGEVKILSLDEYPPPLRRLVERERRMVHLILPATIKRRLDALSRAKGIPHARLVRRWVEEGLERDAG